ncbi:MAG: UDPGP type 1 family protein, partial [Planctomycetes bacterium]|nr:UDPGP type 1 family protein [Planctomycetota bacterium]
MRQIESIRRELVKYKQEHLLRFYDQLSEPRQAALIEQLSGMDFARLDDLIARYLRATPAQISGHQIHPPEIVSTRTADPKCERELLDARRRGEELIAAGKVAAFVVAGGQATRLGCQGPKGCFEATPVAKKPLFRIFAEQILAASYRAKIAIPWYVMTSPVNDVATRAFFRQNDYFGLDRKDVFFLRQGTMPVFDFDGKILLADKGRVAESADGHGGSLLALRKSGALEDMAARGIEIISYFQVDNPLVRCIDPLFLGLHEARGAEMSAKALPKLDPMEKLGNFCCMDGKVTIIEYSDMPQELATATTDDGHLRFSFGNVAIHALSRSFVERLTGPDGAELPYHRAEKKVAFVDETANLIEPGRPNAIKLEMFVFDALPLADKTVILETSRSEEFSPIKNAAGSDSPATSLHDQIRRAAEWLEEAGASVPRDAA